MKRWLDIVVVSVALYVVVGLWGSGSALAAGDGSAPAASSVEADITAAAESVSAGKIRKRVVWNLQPQPGRTYRNLIIRGGVRVAWQSINDVTFIDCDFRSAAVLLTVQARDDGSDASKNWKFIRCTFVGATRDDWGHSHGAFLQGVDNFTFQNCLFKNNGWLDEARFNQNHNVYMLDVHTVRFYNCTFQRAAAQGLKALGYKRVVVDGCTFRGNLIDIGSDDRSASGYLIVRNSHFYNTGGVDSIGQTLGWSLALEHYNNDLKQVQIRKCTWHQPAVNTNVWAMKFAGGELHSAEVVGCDLRQWKVNTNIWPKVVNGIGGRLQISGSTGVYR
ncbi:MAG: right-handed parallel beta-helix repeat-containing protein [Phycisphaeraceae bacterium]|nr:right-handed parallel beta-helix repeat-containing protein [Phycisphaeraceae bacterium]